MRKVSLKITVTHCLKILQDGAFLFCAAIILCVTGLAERSYAVPIKISVPPYPQGKDLLTLDHPITFVLRSAVGGSLIRQSAAHPAGFSYWYSDALASSPNSRNWSFRIRPGAVLQSGRELSEADVIYSLEQCTAPGEAGGLSKVRAGYFSNIAKPGRWITVEFKNITSFAKKSLLPELLGRCTLLDRTTHSIFGKEHGQGTNFSTVGPFAVRDFRPSRSMTLKRRVVYHDEYRTGASEIEISVHMGDYQALTALRSGGIDLFFPKDRGVASEVQKDETLESLQCSIYYVVFRKGLRVICQPELEVSLLSYQ